MRARRTSLLTLLLAAGSAGAFAGEGSLPVRVGDTVRGTLVSCRDRQVFETELVRGERFRVRVTLEDVTAAPELRIETADGTDVTHLARVISSAGVISGGPLRVPESGIYRVSLTSGAAHEIRYSATTSVARRRTQAVRLASNGRTAQVLAAAGSTLTLKTRRGVAPRIVVGLPGETPRELAGGDPLLAALAGGGLSAPVSGSYSFSVAVRSRARIVVTPPAATTPVVVDFPALPADDSVTSWYASTGWIADAAAPGVPAFWSTVLPDALAAPAATPPAPQAADTSSFIGPAGGMGMPIAGAPSLAEVFANGVATDTAAGRSYTVSVPRPGLGQVTYHVAFLVDGRAAAAPMSLAGRVAMTWSVTSAATTHSGHWTLAFDPVRSVGVLDGSESLTVGQRTTAVAARGFAVASGAPGWPTGTLTWRLDDPQSGPAIVRRETFDGTPTVHVETGSSLDAASSADVSLAH